jgi:hypothetical protein
VKEETICVECKHHHIKGRLARLRHKKDLRWWDHRCAAPAVRVKEKRDPVTGEKIGDSMPACMHINDGSCEHYEANKNG